MQEQEIKVKYENICTLLSARKLKPAFDLLEQLIVFTGLAELHEKYISREAASVVVETIVFSFIIIAVI